MNVHLQRAALPRGLVDIVGLAIQHGRIDDAGKALEGLRVLRPALAELVTFDAWIAIKRGEFSQALDILPSVRRDSPVWWMAQGLLALCQFATGDVAYLETAAAVREHGDSPQADALAALLLPSQEPVEI